MTNPADMKSALNLQKALLRVYQRAERPSPWSGSGNLPWNEPEFSARMLREHLDESHGAASRQTAERLAILDWLWTHLDLRPEQRLLDVTCGPGLYAVPLAQRGLHVTGVDFSPAAIAHARSLAQTEQVSQHCRFVEQDVRRMEVAPGTFDAALLLYGQLAVFKREEAQALLANIAQALRPGARLCVELLHPERVDKEDGRWWYTDDTGLWGERPFLHLGERFWLAEEKMSIERFYILHLVTGQLDEITLCDQVYEPDEMTAMMKAAGFTAVSLHPAWDGLPLYDAEEWIVYLAQK